MLKGFEEFLTIQIYIKGAFKKKRAGGVQKETSRNLEYANR